MDVQLAEQEGLKVGVTVRPLSLAMCHSCRSGALEVVRAQVPQRVVAISGVVPELEDRSVRTKYRKTKKSCRAC